VRTVAFYNGWTFKLSEHSHPTVGTWLHAAPLPPEQRSRLGVQALLKIDGQWDAEPRDWTNTPVVTFCRDLKAERIEEAILIWSNARLANADPSGAAPPDKHPTLWVSNMGCWRWMGTVEVLKTQPDLTYSLSATVTYERTSPSAAASAAATGAMPLSYRAVEGRMDYRVSADSEGCQGFGEGRGPIVPETSPMSIFSHVLAGPAYRRAGFVVHSAPDAFTYDVDCGTAGRETRPLQGSGGMTEAAEVSPDGRLIEGEEELDDGTRIRWRLEAQRE
jgi:hypothetical protein